MNPPRAVHAGSRVYRQPARGAGSLGKSASQRSRSVTVASGLGRPDRPRWCRARCRVRWRTTPLGTSSSSSAIRISRPRDRSGTSRFSSQNSSICWSVRATVPRWARGLSSRAARPPSRYRLTQLRMVSAENVRRLPSGSSQVLSANWAHFAPRWPRGGSPARYALITWKRRMAMGLTCMGPPRSRGNARLGAGAAQRRRHRLWELHGGATMPTFTRIPRGAPRMGSCCAARLAALGVHHHPPSRRVTLCSSRRTDQGTLRVGAAFIRISSPFQSFQTSGP
jgi:hypothetical protein